MGMLVSAMVGHVASVAIITVWNIQLISYAGYKSDNGTIIGDPARVEFTEVSKVLFIKL